MKNQKLIEKIKRLKKEKNAVILVHNYQRPEIYEVGDFIGDSLELAMIASKTKAKTIVFCGVKFMAETAKIVNPSKTVLIPEMTATCPMAEMVNVEELKNLKKRYPKAAVVCYVNTTAEIKAESDICCTSANAIRIVNSLKNKQIIFVPDKNLGNYVKNNTKKEIILWDGFCYVHARILEEKVRKAKKNKRNAELMVHPECNEGVVALADAVCSTSGMISHAKNSEKREFIVATEEGMTYRLMKEVPEKKFYNIGGTCVNMKRITLESVYKALKFNEYEIEVPEKIRKKAEKALKRMLEVKK